MFTRILQTHNARLGWRIVSRGVALLLLATAGLKFEALMSKSLDVGLWLSHPRQLLAVILAEMALAIWLFVGEWNHVAWIGALFFFLCALGVATESALMGQASCPCFGRVHASPWYAVSLDVSVICLMAIFRPAHLHRNLHNLLLGKRSRKQHIVVGVMGAAFGGIGILSAFAPELLQRWRGEPLSLRAQPSDIGDGKVGEWKTVEVSVTNNRDATIHILGGTATCNCVTISSLPATLEPGASRTVPIRVKFTGGAGKFARRFILYTDIQNQPYVTGVIRGRVTAAPAT